MKIIFAALLLASASAFSQNRLDITNRDVDVNTNFFQVVAGTPVTPTTFYRVVEGSAFFKDQWMKGAVAFEKGGKEYQNLILKLDLLENKLHFRDVKGQEMICNNALALVRLRDSITAAEYQFIHTSFVPAFSSMKAGWVEVIADGSKAQLYAHRKKTVQESRPYGSATMEQRILNGDFFYLVVGNQLTKVKKSQDLVDALPDKKQELQQWVNSNKEKGESGLVKLVNYYNSLFAPK